MQSHDVTLVDLGVVTLYDLHNLVCTMSQCDLGLCLTLDLPEFFLLHYLRDISSITKIYRVLKVIIICNCAMSIEFKFIKKSINKSYI